MDLPEPHYRKKISLQKKHNKLKTVTHVTKILHMGNVGDKRYITSYLNKPSKLR